MDWITFLLSTPHNDPHLPFAWDADVPGRTLSWNEYVHAVKSVAAGLQATCLEDQDCVALLSENDIYYHALGDAVIAAGGMFCPMQTSRKVAELAHQLRTASVKLLFASVKFLDLALEAASSAGIPNEAIFVYDPPGVEIYQGQRTCMSRLMFTDDTQWRNPNISKDPRAIMAYRMFSSGTTGSPKAAEISHYTHIARIDQRNRRPFSEPTEKARALIWTPIYHSSSQRSYHQAAMGSQIMYVTSDKEVEDVPALIDIIHECNITDAAIPPYFLLPVVKCVQNGTRSTEDLKTLTKVKSAGSTIDPHAAHQFRAVFPEIEFLCSYGTTEAGGIAFGPGPDISSPGVIGNTLPDVELKLVDPETLVEAGHGEDGEVCVRSLEVFSGYHNNPEANVSSLLKDPLGNWFRTGDKGHLDPETRHLILTGRYKEIFKIDLKQVAPEEIESVIMQHEAIEDAAVLPVPAKHDQTQVEVKAYVVIKDSTKRLSAEDIISFVATKLSSHKVPRGGVVFCDEIPRNALKKVVRRKLLEIDARED